MSQIAKLFDGSAAGDVETLTGDAGGPVGVDAAFNINILTDDFLTSTGTPGTNTIRLSLDNAQSATGQTIGAVNTDIITLNLGAVATTRIVEAKVTAFEPTTPAGSVYNLICGTITNGAVASLVNVQDKYNAEMAALAGGNANFVVVGNTLIVRVTGVAGLTINWKVVVHWSEV